MNSLFNFESEFRVSFGKQKTPNRLQGSFINNLNSVTNNVVFLHNKEPVNSDIFETNKSLNNNDIFNI